MTHLFISVVWGQDPVRIAYAKKLIEIYPFIYLLQNRTNIESTCGMNFNYEIKNNEFIDYLMINEFLKTLNDFESLTYIDSDLLLSSDFFSEIIKRHEAFKAKKPKKPYFLTYRKCFLIKRGLIDTCMNSMVYNRKLGIEGGATGRIMSWNKAFIDNYHFKNFKYGGADFFLTNAILGKCMSIFEDEYFKVPKTEYDYVDCDVVHQEHEERENKVTPWEKYKDIIN